MKRLRNRKFANHKKKMIYYSLFGLLLLISIGYAYLQAALSINGNTTIAANTWDIYFENLSITNGSVTASTPAAINGNSTSISYTVLLSKPGDYYEFSVDTVNAGTISAKVSLVNLQGITSAAEPYLETSYKYESGLPIAVGDLLNPGARKKIVVRVTYKEDLNSLPDTDIPLNLTYTINCTQTNEIENNASNLLQNLKEAGNPCIEKYEGQVTDKVGVTETATNVYFDKCADKRNVIFGGFCWQVIRTTETGGIKIIYNGEPVGGKCESTRGDHKGIVGSNGSTYMYPSEYLYASSYTYDLDTSEFTLVSPISATWGEGTYEQLKGKYTCRTMNDTCSTLYQVTDKHGMGNAYAYSSSFKIENTDYSHIGKSPFNSNYEYISRSGYMFNREYVTNEKKALVEDVSGNTYAYGESYTDNGNGTYTINSPVHLSIWPTSSSEYTKALYKYICKNPINSTCGEVWYVTGTAMNSFNYFTISYKYKFASGFTYSNGTYTLSGESETFWNLYLDDYKNYLNNHHYTCWNTSGSCSSISYIVSNVSSLTSYVNLTNGKGANDALVEMLSADDVNAYDSTIKSVVDVWYSQNLSNKTNMLEDTVFCNSRDILNINNWNPNGGDVTKNLQFKNNQKSAVLSCANITDQIAVGNTKAKLKYPVALLQAEEINNINEASLLITSDRWWTFSPAYVAVNTPHGRAIYNGNLSEGFYYTSYGVRPVVSLSSSIVFSSGTGSETDPWIIVE